MGEGPGVTQTKPAGLGAWEEWAWDNAEPGSWQRRALANAIARKEEERPGVGGWERATPARSADWQNAFA